MKNASQDRKSKNRNPTNGIREEKRRKQDTHKKKIIM